MRPLSMRGPRTASTAGSIVNASSTTQIDRAGGGEAHDGEERDADHAERRQRDDDGQPGEDDGAAGGRGREPDGFQVFDAGRATAGDGATG